MKILLLDNYDSFTYNLLHAVKELGATDIEVVRNDQIGYRRGFRCTTGESERGISRCTDPGQYPTTRCIIRRAGKRNSRRTLSLLGGQPGGFS